MNLVGVEPRLSLLEAEEEGGGGSDSLWEPYEGGIRPKDGKLIFLENEENPNICCNFNDSWIIFEGQGGKRMLSALPIERQEDVISVCDLDRDKYFTLNETSHLIELEEPPLWEVTSTSNFIRPKDSRFLSISAASLGQTLISGNAVSVNANSSHSQRCLDVADLSDEVQVIAWKDLSKDYFTLNETSHQVELKTPPPTYYVPYNLAGDVDVKEKLGMKPLSITVAHEAVIQFTPSTQLDFMTINMGQFTSLEFSLDLMLDNTVAVRLTWTSTHWPDG
jgi:hypothetical protein